MVIARNLLSLAELPRPLEASIAAPVERGEGNAVDESAAGQPKEASSASPSLSTAVTTAREAGLQFGQPGTPGRLAAGRYSGSAQMTAPSRGLQKPLTMLSIAAWPRRCRPCRHQRLPFLWRDRRVGASLVGAHRRGTAPVDASRLRPGRCGRRSRQTDGNGDPRLSAAQRRDRRWRGDRSARRAPAQRRSASCGASAAGAACCANGRSDGGPQLPGLFASLVHGFQQLIGWDSDSAAIRLLFAPTATQAAARRSTAENRPPERGGLSSTPTVLYVDYIDYLCIGNSLLAKAKQPACTGDGRLRRFDPG